jgi:hypothetical protein
MVKGKRKDHWFGLYHVDEQRFWAIRDWLEDKTGRPSSPTKVILYLLDCHDDLRMVDEAVQAKTKGKK